MKNRSANPGRKWDKDLSPLITCIVVEWSEKNKRWVDPNPKSLSPSEVLKPKI